MANGPRKLPVFLPFHPNVIFSHFEPLAKIGIILGLFPMMNFRNLMSQPSQKGRLNIWFIFMILLLIITITDVLVSLYLGDIYRLRSFFNVSTLCLVLLHRFCGIGIWLQFVTNSTQLMEFFQSWSKFSLFMTFTEKKLKKASYLLLTSFVLSVVFFDVFHAYDWIYDCKSALILTQLGPNLSAYPIRLIISYVYFSQQVYIFTFTSYFLYAFACCLAEQARELKIELNKSSINDSTFGERMERNRECYLYLSKMLHKFQSFLSPALTAAVVQSCQDMCLNIANSSVALMTDKPIHAIVAPGGYIVARSVSLVILFWLADHMQAEVR